MLAIMVDDSHKIHYCDWKSAAIKDLKHIWQSENCEKLDPEKPDRPRVCVDNSV